MKNYRMILVRPPKKVQKMLLGLVICENKLQNSVRAPTPLTKKKLDNINLGFRPSFFSLSSRWVLLSFRQESSQKMSVCCRLNPQLVSAYVCFKSKLRVSATMSNAVPSIPQGWRDWVGNGGDYRHSRLGLGKPVKWCPFAVRTNPQLVLAYVF